MTDTIAAQKETASGLPSGEVVAVETTSSHKSSSSLEVDTETGTSHHETRKEKKERKPKPFIVLVAMCAAMGGLIFGYDIAGAGGTFLMDGFQIHFGWECAEGDVSCVPASQSVIDHDQGFINGLFGTGATFGAIASPWMADTYGRRPCLGLAAIIFTIGAILQMTAPAMPAMFVGRAIAGFGIGSLSMCSPVYIAELAPENVRGMLATLWQLAITSGILIASAANLGLKHWDQGWRLSYGGNILFAILLMVALLFMPESPRWLIVQGQEDKARKAMSRIRYDDTIEDDLLEMKIECHEELGRGVSTWREVFVTENKMRYRLFLGMGLQTFQQLCGINAIMFYAPTILANFFGESEAITGTFILNGINFLSTFITIYAVEKVGRVKLLLSGGIIMTFALIAMAILSSLDATKQIGYIVVTFAGIFIIGFAYSWGPIVWVVCAEIFPLRTRGKATGLTTMSNWTWTTIVGATFPKASTASLSGCFAFFSIVIFAGICTVYFFMAEIAKKNLIEIDEAYENHKPKLIRKKY